MSSIHYGKGQTEVELNFAPGDYALTLQFANHSHVSYGAVASDTIQITITD